MCAPLKLSIFPRPYRRKYIPLMLLCLPTVHNKKLIYLKKQRFTDIKQDQIRNRLSVTATHTHSQNTPVLTKNVKLDPSLRQLDTRLFFSGPPMPPVQRMTPRMQVVSPNVRSLNYLPNILTYL